MKNHKININQLYTVSGSLQLLFGVKGERCNTREVISKIINNCKCEFIRPSQKETIPKLKK